MFVEHVYMEIQKVISRKNSFSTLDTNNPKESYGFGDIVALTIPQWYRELNPQNIEKESNFCI